VMVVGAPFGAGFGRSCHDEQYVPAGFARYKKESQTRKSVCLLHVVCVDGGAAKGKKALL
jgi:hypothetical protein